MDHRTNEAGTAGFIITLAGVILFWVPFIGQLLLVLGFAFSIYGLIIGIRRHKRLPFSIAGLLLATASMLIIYTVAKDLVEKF